MTVQEEAHGQAEQNAVATVTFNGGASDAYDLGFLEASTNTPLTWLDTVPIAYQATAATVQADLAADGMAKEFPAISVTGSWPSFTVTFGGPLPSYHDGALFYFVGVANAAVKTISYGASAFNEIQDVNMRDVVGGTFTLSFNGATTTPIAFNASAGDVQAALAALPTIGANNVTVDYWSGTTSSGAGFQTLQLYTVEFVGALSAAAEPLIAANVSNLVEGPIEIATATHASIRGTDAVQQVVVSAIGGTFRVGFGGQWTPQLAVGAAAAALQADLNALSTISHVVVTGAGTAASPYLVTFEGAQSGADQ